MSVQNETQMTQQIDLKVEEMATDDNKIEIELNVKTTDLKKALFRLDKYDILTVIIIFVVSALILVVCTVTIASNSSLLFTYVFIIGYTSSLCCAVLLNSGEINTTKRYAILAISYTALFIVEIICFMSIAKFEVFASITVLFTSYWVLLVIFQFGKSSGMSTKESLKYLYSIKALITPIFFHFADIATDVGTTIEYFNRSKQENIQRVSSVNYNTIFIASVFILIFSRIIACLIIKYYTSSNIDCLLQALDIYICKILKTEWQLNYIRAGRFHKFVQLTEAVFESAPFSIISIYIIMEDGGSFIIWVSALSSLISVAARTISQDERFFTEESGAKTLDFSKKNKECSKTRCLCCNWTYLLRLFWRILDVVSYVLLYPLVWYFNGFSMFMVILWWQVFAVILANLANLFSGQAIEVFYIGSLLYTLPNSWYLNGWSDLWPVFLVLWKYFVAYWLLLVMIIFNTDSNYFPLIVTEAIIIFSCNILYLMFAARNARLILVGNGCCCTWRCCGDNWVQSSVSTSLTIKSCNSMNEIQELSNEGIDIKRFLTHVDTWLYYPNPKDLVTLVNKYNIDLNVKACFNYKRNYIYVISANCQLEWESFEDAKSVLKFLQSFNDIRGDDMFRLTLIDNEADSKHYWPAWNFGHSITPILLACANHSDSNWIDALILQDFPELELIDDMKYNTEKNKTDGKEIILQKIETLYSLIEKQ